MSRVPKDTAFRGWVASSTAKVRAFFGWAIGVTAPVSVSGPGELYAGLCFINPISAGTASIQAITGGEVRIHES